MQTLIELIKTEQPTCTGISLVVHPANVVAQSLYQQSGFVATGEERWGEPVYRLKFA
jgi:ribosomal protein S18 acetylase RimI-like enzyme